MNHPFRSPPRMRTVRLVVEASHEEEVDERHDPVRLQELVQGHLNTTSIYALGGTFQGAVETEGERQWLKALNRCETTQRWQAISL